jgi:hypothetical protein
VTPDRLSILRWLAVWLLLAGIYAAGWLLSQGFAGSGGTSPGEALAHFAAIPAAQTLALAVVAAVRRQGGPR